MAIETGRVRRIVALFFLFRMAASLVFPDIAIVIVTNPPSATALVVNHAKPTYPSRSALALTGGTNAKYPMMPWLAFLKGGFHNGRTSAVLIALKGWRGWIV
jgi:hypothetical protein